MKSVRVLARFSFPRQFTVPRFGWNGCSLSWSYCLPIGRSGSRNRAHVGTWREVAGFAVIQFRPRSSRVNAARKESGQMRTEEWKRDPSAKDISWVLCLHLSRRNVAWRRIAETSAVHPLSRDTRPRCTCFRATDPVIFWPTLNDARLSRHIVLIFYFKSIPDELHIVKIK